MELQQTSKEPHSIQAYTNTSVQINDTLYTTSLVISRDKLISPWAHHSGESLNDDDVALFKGLEPEVILIGSTKAHQLQTTDAIKQLLQAHIGVECLSIDAACRTFNVLLSEYRKVVLGLIF